MELKYILDRHGNFAIFSVINSHAEMARGFYVKTIVSAGFCRLSSCKSKVSVECYGKSTTLGLESRPEDQAIINKSLTSRYY